MQILRLSNVLSAFLLTDTVTIHGHLSAVSADDSSRQGGQPCWIEEAQVVLSKAVYPHVCPPSRSRMCMHPRPLSIQ